MLKGNTIAAIATAVGNSGIGIVRISGEDAFQIIEQIFVRKNKKSIADWKSHTIHYGYIVDQEEIIDEVLVMIMKGPHSYTAEDIVEIDCHGGNFVTRKILDTVLKYGARPAQPGEFTKRAFLNGRIDLSQSEAVIDVIQSQNMLALKSSVNQLQGSLNSKIRSMRETILYEIAFIEAALDDPEQMSTDGYREKLSVVVDHLLEETDRLLKSSDNGKLLKEGINTVIIGRPNVGKSSLMNLLVGEEKAIVTNIAGTTRDILEESILLGGIQLNIIDTAGIRSTEDLVEKIGVERALKTMEEADLIIYVVDASENLDENDETIIEAIQDRKAVILMNKSDLEQKITAEQLQSRLNHTILSVSAKEETGMQELEQTIQELFFKGNLSFNDEVFITNVRHRSELQDCRKSLMMVKDSIEAGMPEDFYSIDLTNAYESLGTIIGESVDDDVVDEIFQKFCMGK